MASFALVHDATPVCPHPLELVHTLSMHESPVGQEIPQPLQLLGSLVVLTQLSVDGQNVGTLDGQVQPPSVQALLGLAQVLPHPPQLLASLVRLTQVSLSGQKVGYEADGQAQPPSTHVSGVVQEVPQVPQLLESLVVLTQVLLVGQ